MKIAVCVKEVPGANVPRRHDDATKRLVRDGDQVLGVLREAAERFDQTLVLVTHDPHVAAAADDVLFLADGRLAGHLVAPTTSQIAARLVELGR